MKRKIIGGFVFAFFTLFGFFSFLEVGNADSEHVIINQIKTGSAYFIELYNPTDSAVSIESWSVQYRGGSAASFSRKNFVSGNKIPPHGYFLIGNSSEYSGSVPLDMSWSQSLSSTGGTVFLVNNQSYLSDDSVSGTSIVDRVAYGAGIYLFAEEFPAPKPSAEQSIERIDFEDSDDNSADFLLNDSPLPRNTSSVKEGGGDEAGDGDDPGGDLSECATSSENVKLNEIFPYAESSDNQYIEIGNFGDACMDISDWKITNGIHKYIFPAGTIIEPGDLLALTRNFSLNHSSPQTVHLLDSQDKEIDQASYTGADKNFSFSFDGSAWVWTSILTPGENNKFDETESEDEKSGTSGSSDYDIRLNELLPYPKGEKNKDSYIEIYNGEDFEINLKDWMLKNNAKTTKFVFPEGYVLKSGGYLTVYRKLFSFALKTSDTIYFMDPDGNTISSVNYTSAKKDISLGFDGDDWKWSSSKTPGKKNKFDPAPKIKIGKIKDAYLGLPILFSAEVRDKHKDELKYVWDFGDGKRSYLQEVNHTYLKKGKYDVTFSVDNGIEKTTKKMKIEVKKYPSFKLEIVGLSPNPLEDDEGGEWIEIKNNSKKKVNLVGWKMVTGQNVLLNHVILSDFEIDAGKTKKMTREYTLFSLGNKAGNLELRYPSGKAAAKISYAKDNIEKGEIYQKLNGQWNWIKTGNDADDTAASEAENPRSEPTVAQDEVTNNQEEAQGPELEKKEEDNNSYADSENDDSETLEIAGKISPMNLDQQKRRITLLNYGTSIKPNECTAENIGNLIHAHGNIMSEGNQYSFTDCHDQKHWATQFLENSLISMNLSINKVWGYF
ncbi:MAG: PKD domain-containing protein [Candidatus Moranbacteria bacterium]|nr:PKD domain-containing protein [Candidatus Moranbacteria bacterium]